MELFKSVGSGRGKLPLLTLVLEKGTGLGQPKGQGPANPSPLPKGPINIEASISELGETEQVMRRSSNDGGQTENADHVSGSAGTITQQTSQQQTYHLESLLQPLPRSRTPHVPAAPIPQRPLTLIPMNDGENRERDRRREEALCKATSGYQPPVRLEFADTPKTYLPRLTDSARTQYPIQHRPLRKRAETSSPIITGVEIIPNSGEGLQVAEKTSLGGVVAFPGTSDEETKAIVTAQTQTIRRSPEGGQSILPVAGNPEILTVTTLDPIVLSDDYLIGYLPVSKSVLDGKRSEGDSDVTENNGSDQNSARNYDGADEGEQPVDDNIPEYGVDDEKESVLVNEGKTNGHDESGPEYDSRTRSPSRDGSPYGYDDGHATDPHGSTAHATDDHNSEDLDHDIDSGARVSNDSGESEGGEATSSLHAPDQLLAASYRQPEFLRWNWIPCNTHGDEYMFAQLRTSSLCLGEILIANTITGLCEKRDLSTIKAWVPKLRNAELNLNIDGLFALGLAQAAGLLLFEALPVFYNAIKHPDIRADGLGYALEKAVGDSEDQLATMRWLRRRGMRINATTTEEYPLTIASKGGFKRAVRLLLDWGADPNFQSFSRVGLRKLSPLRVAAEAGHVDIVRLLLEKGANANDSEAVGNAARSGHLDIMKILVAAGADANPSSFYPYTDPFADAAWRGHIHVVRYMLEMGISLEDDYLGQSRGDFTFRRTAGGAAHNTEAICFMLLDHGVKVELEPFLYRYPTYDFFASAAVTGKTELLQWILDGGADPDTTGYWAWEVSNPENLTDIKSGSMLTLACSAGRIDAVRLLLQRGAQAAGPRGRTDALHAAARNGHVDVVELLLDHGANIESDGYTGATPIHHAAGAGSCKCIDSLLRHGALLESRDGSGQTPLIFAARQGKLEAVEQLLNEGASVSARDREGWTAAHRAAWNGHERVVTLLFERNANPGAETDSGLKVEDLLKYAEESPAVNEEESEYGSP